MNRIKTSQSDILADMQRKMARHESDLRSLRNQNRETTPIPYTIGGTPPFPPTDPLPYERTTLQVDATKGVNWELVYRAGSGSGLKWEYIGGPPIFAEVNTRESTSTLTTWVDLATVGPSITIARGGDYLIEAYTMCESSSTNNNVMGIGISVAGVVAATDQVLAAPIYSLNANTGFHTSYIKRVIQVNAGNVVKIQYYTGEVANHFWQRRRLFITPVRIA